MAGDGEDKKPNVHSQSAYITLKVKGQDENAVLCKIKKTTKLELLMKGYCDKKCLELETIAFLYNGIRIKPKQTPEEWKMEDGDEIDAFLHQDGGSLF